MPYSLDQALLLLQTTELTPQALTNLAKQVSIEAQGAVTVLYGGKLPDGTYASDAITAMVTHGEDIRVIDKSPAGMFLASRDFKIAAAKASGLTGSDITKFVSNEYTGPATNWLFSTDTTTSPWAEASKRFAQATTGEVRLLASGADATRIFNQVELPALLQKTDITKLEGYTLDALKAMYPEAGGIPPNTSKIFEGLKLASEQNIVFSGLTVSNKGHFLDAALLNHSNFLGAHPDALQAWANHIKAHPDKVPLFQSFADLHTTTAKNLAKIGDAIPMGIANKLGPIGIGIGFGLAAVQANAATSSEQAKAIMRDWALDAVGSAAGEAVFGVVATIGVGVAAAAGVAISAPLAGAIVFGAAITGGFFGGDAAKDFYRLLDDRDDNGRRDIIDKLGNLFFGVDAAITTPLPADLNGDKFAIDASMTRDEMVALAKGSDNAGIAWRYALRELNSFVITDVSYAAHNTDGSLGLYDKDSNPGGLTDEYLVDRAAMLAWKLQFDKNGARDDDDGPRTGSKPYIEDWDAGYVAGNWDFIDLARGASLKLAIDGAGVSTSDHQVVFGSKLGDTINGSGDTDRLYGMAGADTLDGKDGADYLEGGADADTYLLQTGLAGIDTLADSGNNTIKVDGQAVTGAFAQVAGMGGDIYYSADKSYQLRKAEDGVWRLSAKNTGTGQYNAVADLKNWKDGDYNLTIGAPTQEPERVPAVVYPNSVAYLAMDGAAAPKGVTFGGGNKSDSFNGSAFDDVITTGGGLGNYVMAYAGDDLVVGGDGKDFIRTGQNASSPTFKDNDIAFGGEASDVLMGGGGDDQLWGEYIDSANEAGGADSGERGDWVSGELGNDTLNGSRRSDVLFGGAGQDIVKGGAGDDLILGDGHYTPFSKSTALPYAESTTQSFIWDDARQDMVKVTPGNYGLHPVTIASGLAYNWTVERTAGDDFALKAPAGLITQQRVAANGGDDRLFGGEGADWMAGQTGNDALFGGDGDDTMYGDDIGMAETDAGQDLMYGDAGNDRMWGGAKNDVMDGGAGNDKLYGEAGDDFLLGGGGDDELSGNEGADTLDGGTGADRLLGGDGDDQLWGADGDDTLDGGAGADRLHGGRGKDQLQGGVGDDTYLFDAGDDAGVVSTANDSEGNNTVELSGGALKDMQLTGSDSAWLLRYTKDDSVQLSGSFKVQWGGRSYTLAELAKAIADATPPDTPPPPANSAPSVAKPLQNTSAVEFVPLVLPIADGTFIDPDKNDKLTYSASLVGGAALPTWLVFDAPTRTLRGTPDGNAAGALQLRITATDAAGLSASSDFELSISDAPTPPAPHTIVGTPGDDTLKGSAGADTMRGDAGNDTLKGLEGDDELHGEDGEDTLRAGDGADKLYGGAGDDTLYGDAGDDVLDGGAGNDTLQGGLGSDTYLFGRGDGQDTLKGQKDTTPGKLDTLRFKDGIAASDVQASRDGSALLLTIAGTGDSVRVENYFTSNNPANDSNPLQQVQFADGTVWDMDAITKRAATGSDASEVLKGTNGADTMYAGAGNDTLQGLDGDDELHGEDGEDTLRAGNGADKLYGGAGDDALYGDAGDDILDGGAGNDIVQGGLGNDTYLFGRGDGQDNLKGQSDTAPGKLNTLRFKDGVDAADVQAGRDGSALLLSIAGTTDSVRVESFFTNDDPGNASNPLQQVQFADGTVWDLNTLVQRALTGNDTSETIKGTVQADTIHAGAGNDTLLGLGGDDLLYGEDGEDTLRAGDGADQLFGGAGDDALYGDAGDDTLYGGAGNDIVQGGLGNDTYLFGRGDGADRITENDTTLGNTDVLSFTAGIDADQLWFRRVGTNLEVSIIGSTDTCTISQWYASDARHIEQFKMADGKTLLDSQVNSLVQAMSAFAPPPAGQSTLAADYQTALNPVIAANWH